MNNNLCCGGLCGRFLAGLAPKLEKLNFVRFGFSVCEQNLNLLGGPAWGSLNKYIDILDVYYIVMHHAHEISQKPQSICGHRPYHKFIVFWKCYLYLQLIYSCSVFNVSNAYAS